MVQAIVQNDSALLADCLARGADPNFKQEGLSPLHVAALFGSSAAITVLAERGADLNARDYMGRTPLHFAALAPASDTIVRQLVSLGADLNVKDDSESTPLDLAGSLNVWPAVDVLTNAGAACRKATRSAIGREVRTPGNHGL